jgi:SAM-dependent methyltransferase
MPEIEPRAPCKICKSPNLAVFDHTAKCRNCGVLLYYPYPESDDALVEGGAGKPWERQEALSWYSASSFLNHTNFTHMLRFAMGDADRGRPWDVLDYGGGGGQFALVCRSHFPASRVYLADISDEALLDEWRCDNIQIPFREFADDGRMFDFIFLNDVFEHVSDPVAVLKLLAGKLRKDGRIFIDTPKQFWIYPLARATYPKLYSKILRGTVSKAHLQIWSKRSFDLTVREAGLKPQRYRECSEFTMPADFYLKNMGITNPLVRTAGRGLYRGAKILVRNKITALLSK